MPRGIRSRICFALVVSLILAACNRPDFVAPTPIPTLTLGEIETLVVADMIDQGAMTAAARPSDTPPVPAEPSLTPSDTSGAPTAVPTELLSCLVVSKKKERNVVKQQARFDDVKTLMDQQSYRGAGNLLKKILRTKGGFNAGYAKARRLWTEIGKTGRGLYSEAMDRTAVTERYDELLHLRLPAPAVPGDSKLNLRGRVLAYRQTSLRRRQQRDSTRLADGKR